jgi:hypothetical protein
MLLKEMFSPVGAPKEDDQDIDWVDDLKFYIDNEDRLLEKYLFPAVKKHKEHVGNPNVYKIYLRAIRPCLEDYCKTFNVEDPEEKFSEEALENLAKQLAHDQEKFIEDGDYEKDK